MEEIKCESSNLLIPRYEEYMKIGFPDYTEEQIICIHVLMARNSNRPAGAKAHLALRERAIFDLRCAMQESMRDLDQQEKTGRSPRRDRLYEQIHGQEKAIHDFARNEGLKAVSVGKHDAGAVFNGFIAICALTWFQQTAQPQKPNASGNGEPTNDYGKFMLLASRPLIEAIDEQFRSGLVSSDWSVIKQRIERAGLRDHPYLKLKSTMTL